MTETVECKGPKERVMMKKRLLFAAAIVSMTVTMGMTVYAGSWKQDNTGWWWQNDDGTYPAGKWEWLDGNGDGIAESYYFDNSGYLLTNTVTPDGYTVNADGAWTVEGVVQTTQISQRTANTQNVQARGNAPSGANTERRQFDNYAITYEYFSVFEEYGNTKYQAIIEIENTSSGNLYLGNATFDIYDLSGKIVASETLISSDPDVIAPGEKGYFYSNGGYLDDVPMGQYTMIPTIKVKKSTLQAKRYPVANTSIKESRYGNVNIVGTVTNDTAKDESLLWLAFVLYDQSGYPIGVYGTNLLDFDAGKTIGFEGNGTFLPDYVTFNRVSSYEVIASPIQYQF